MRQTGRFMVKGPSRERLIYLNSNGNSSYLSKANLTRAIVVEANLENAVLNSCSIYGIAAWDVQLEGAKQDSLIITRDTEPTITVDNLKVAQFIYLLLNNTEIREVIDTIGQ